jgi:hypothetical protein
MKGHDRQGKRVASIALFLYAPSLALSLTLIAATAARSASPSNLVSNPGFEQAGANPSRAARFDLIGDVARKFAGTAYEFSSMGVALDSGRDLDDDGRREGMVSQVVTIGEGLPGRWYRFKLRGLPEDGFAVGGDDLFLRADFFGDGGKKSFDGVTREIYAIVERERRDLTANGVRHRNGAETWRTYAFEFRLPFAEIDRVRVGAGFRNGAGRARDGSFWIDDLSLEAIPTPADAAQAAKVRPAAPSPVDVSKLVPLGGRWSYLPAPGDARGTVPVFNHVNADRLFMKEAEGRYFNPFAENMSAWLKKGYLDLRGDPVTRDVFRPDNVVVGFDADSMIVRARNLPNHPTAKYIGDRTIGGNPSFIQEYDSTYYLPLNPVPNPNAVAMDPNNANRALNMGPIGVAVNGVVFFNPFDAGMTDATDLMDRCCGHPNPDNQYHYHKYPVCVKSPFADEGRSHSPVLGWALDGFAIYGPYESDGVMAKDSTTNPLNAFNVHRDPERGWHYHVTPGKFPYIIGGYWGRVDPRNLPRGPRGGPGPLAAGFQPGGGVPERGEGRGGMRRGRNPREGRNPRRGGGPGAEGRGGPGGRGGPQGRPGEFGPPPHPVMTALDADGDRSLSADEIANAPRALKSLDANSDGKLTPDELRPPGAPDGPRFQPPPPPGEKGF